jgi:hypothetical protein
MKLHDLLAQALHYAIEDRMALSDAYQHEGEVAASARRDAARFRALHERLKLTPARKIYSTLTEDMESLTVTEIKERISAEANVKDQPRAL